MTECPEVSESDRAEEDNEQKIDRKKKEEVDIEVIAPGTQLDDRKGASFSDRSLLFISCSFFG